MSTNDCKYFVLFSNEVFACLILIRHLMMLMMMYLLFLNSYSPIALFLPLSNSTNFILLTFICLFVVLFLLVGWKYYHDCCHEAVAVGGFHVSLFPGNFFLYFVYNFLTLSCIQNFFFFYLFYSLTEKAKI